jgi:hypothetical protein
MIGMRRGCGSNHCSWRLMTTPSSVAPASDAITRAIVIRQPRTDQVSVIVIGLKSGATKISAVRFPSLWPAIFRSPIASGIVVREQPGISAPVAIATASPRRPPSRWAIQRSGTNAWIAAAASTPTASHGRTLSASEPKREAKSPRVCTASTQRAVA